MRERYINFIYALVIGRSIKGKGKFDVWDYEQGVKYFVDIVMPCFLPDKMIFHVASSGFYPFAQLKKGKKYYNKVDYNKRNRKEEEDETDNVSSM